jgi:Ca2+-binding RTX toxin-like protein
MPLHGRPSPSLGGALTVLFLLLLAPAAHAKGTLTHPQANAYRFTDAGTFVNNLTVGLSGTNLTVRDSAQQMTVSATSGCTGAGTTVPANTTVFCPTANVNLLVATLGPGNDTFTSNIASQTFSTNAQGEDGNDTLIGGPGPDRLQGGAGTDTVRGNGGDDLLVPGTGDDGLVDGGDGRDEMSFNDGRTTGVTAILDPTIHDSDGPNEKLTNIEDLTGGPGDDTLTGNAGVNKVTGGSGNDTVNGLGGDDTVAGVDGNDTVLGGTGDDLLGPGPGSDIVDGQAGIDRVDYQNNRTAGITVTLDGVQNDGGVDDAPGMDNLLNVERVEGSDFNDTLNGSASPVGITFLGNGGDDHIIGSPFIDTLLGDLGNDTIESRDGVSDTVDCGDGTDTDIADTVDVIAGCETVSFPPPPPTPTPAPTPIPTPTPTPPPPPLKTMFFKSTYVFFPKHPKKTTRFAIFKLRDIPKGTHLEVRCLDKKRKPCKGHRKVFKKTFTKKQPKGGKYRLRAVEQKYRAGSSLEIMGTHAGYRTQIKIIKIIKNHDPDVDDRCLTPPSTKRKRC